MKSPGPLKTWMGLSLLWTSWKNCEFMINITWCFSLDCASEIRLMSESEVWSWSDFCRFPRFLQGNRIRSVTKKSFSGLEALQHLWVGLVFSLIASKSPSCKLSRVNHTETQRLFVRAVHPNCLLPFLRFDVESRKSSAISIFTCVPDYIDHRGKWRELCVCVCVCVCMSVQQLHLILIRVFSQPLPELKAAQSLGLSWLTQQTAAQSFIVLEPRPFSSLDWSFLLPSLYGWCWQKKLPSFWEDLTSPNDSFLLSSAEIWVITPSCPSKRTPSLRWRTCRSCKCDHG